MDWLAAAERGAGLFLALAIATVAFSRAYKVIQKAPHLLLDIISGPHGPKEIP